MRAAVVEQYGSELTVREVPEPTPGPGEVLVRVEAAAVNPADPATRSGALQALAPHLQPPLVLGWDVAGVVERLGEGANGWRVGQRVIGMSLHLAAGVGTHAELVVMPVASLAAAPESVDAPTAASLPLAGLTAIQALDLLAVTAGTSVLITGAVGAVGGFAVQLAAARGAHVVAVVGEADAAAARELGATDVVVRGEDVAGRVRALLPDGVDAALDAAAAGGVIGAVRSGGGYVAVIAPTAPEPERGIDPVVVQVQPDGAALDGLARSVDAGRLTLRVADVLPLERAAEAYARVERGGVRGKVVLVP